MAGILLASGHPARADQANDEIYRPAVQSQHRTLTQPAGDAAQAADEDSTLAPHASPEDAEATTKPTDDADPVEVDRQQEAADPGVAPEIPAAPLSEPPARPASSPALAGLIDLLRRKGDAAFQSGNISEARRYYHRGADAGCSPCAEDLAKTYDAAALRRIGAIGVTPDPALVQAWREMARVLGQNSAPQ